MTDAAVPPVEDVLSTFKLSIGASIKNFLASLLRRAPLIAGALADRLARPF